MTAARHSTFFNVIEPPSVLGLMHAIDITLEENAYSSLNFAARYGSMKDFLYRAASIPLAPIGHVVYSLFFVVLSIETLVHGNYQESAISLLYATALILTAALSPLINFIDLVGGGINTALEADSNTSPSV